MSDNDAFLTSDDITSPPSGDTLFTKSNNPPSTAPAQGTYSMSDNTISDSTSAAPEDNAISAVPRGTTSFTITPMSKFFKQLETTVWELSRVRGHTFTTVNLKTTVDEKVLFMETEVASFDMVFTFRIKRHGRTHNPRITLNRVAFRPMDFEPYLTVYHNMTIEKLKDIHVLREYPPESPEIGLQIRRSQSSPDELEIVFPREDGTFPGQVADLASIVHLHPSWTSIWRKWAGSRFAARLRSDSMQIRMAWELEGYILLFLMALKVWGLRKPREHPELGQLAALELFIEDYEGPGEHLRHAFFFDEHYHLGPVMKESLAFDCCSLFPRWIENPFAQAPLMQNPFIQ